MPVPPVRELFRKGSLLQCQAAGFPYSQNHILPGH